MITDGRTARRKYPWEKLDKINSTFKWKNVEDSKNIRSSAANLGYKVSVRNIDGVLHVIRIK